jgi:DUF1680 family protein
VLASLPGYLYSTSESEIWIHNYVPSSARVDLGEKDEVVLRQITRYPNDGDITIRVQCEPGAEFGLRVRLPGWCSQPSIQINGSPVGEPLKAGSYARIHRRWTPGDEVQIGLPMQVRLMESHSRLTSNAGQTAITRGPLVYCIEQADNGAGDIRDIVLCDGASWEVVESKDLSGIACLSSAAVRRDDSGDGPLYKPRGRSGRLDAAKVTAVPYFAWANRSAGPMRVWIPTVDAAG